MNVDREGGNAKNLLLSCILRAQYTEENGKNRRVIHQSIVWIGSLEGSVPSF